MACVLICGGESFSLTLGEGIHDLRGRGPQGEGILDLGGGGGGIHALRGRVSLIWGGGGGGIHALRGRVSLTSGGGVSMTSGGGGILDLRVLMSLVYSCI